MNLAAMIMFMIWVSIVFFTIGGWAFMTIMRQDKSMYNWDDVDDIELDELDRDNIF